MVRTRQARLGRGLSTLMAQGAGEEASAAAEAATSPDPTATAPANNGDGHADGERVVTVSLDAIEPNTHQPRSAFDDAALRSLAESIRQAGVLQPVVLRPKDGSTYQLVAGERRWRAARMAGLEAIPALIRETDERQAAASALIENLQREDLDPMEQAEAFARLKDDFGLSHDQIAEQVGLNRATITNALRLLNLAEPVQRLIREGKLTAGQAKVLAGVSDPDRQQALAGRAVREAWPVRKMEEAVKAERAGSQTAKNGESSGSNGKSAQIADLERQIGEALQTRVHIKAGRKKGSGTLAIEFYSIDHFDQLLAQLGVEPE